MTVTTRKKKQEAAMAHILAEIFEGNGALALFTKQKGIKALGQIKTLHVKVIEEGKYKDAADDEQTLTYGEIGQFRALQGYIGYRTAARDIIGLDDWPNVTYEMVDKFSGTDYFDPSKTQALKAGAADLIAKRAAASSTTTATTTNTTTGFGTAQPRGELYEFCKSIKHDQAAFPTLNGQKEWSNYKITLTAIAKSQRVAEVLDEHHTPATQEEIELFAEKQTFLYAVFLNTLKANFARTIVKDNPDDAQAIYTKLCKVAEKSTTADSIAADLLTSITSICYGDGTFEGTAQGFVLHWCNMVCEYNELIPTSKKVLDDLKLSMLQNAVQPLTDLASIKNTAKMVNNGAAITYSFYYDLLISAVQSYDLKNKGTGGKARHRVYMTNYDEDVTYLNEDDWNAYAHAQMINGNAHMDHKSWVALSQGDQKMWDGMSESGKKTILSILDDPDKDKPAIVTPARSALLQRPKFTRFAPGTTGRPPFRG